MLGESGGGPPVLGDFGGTRFKVLGGFVGVVVGVVDGVIGGVFGGL